MATIANLPNGKYKAIIKKNGRILKTKTFIRKRDAQTWARRIEAAREELEALGSSGAKITFHELADEYMHQWNGKDPNQAGRVMFWCNHLGSKKIIDVTADDIRTILDDYAHGNALRGDGAKKTAVTGRQRAPATVNRIKNACSAIFCFGMQRGYLSSNPVSKVPNKAVNNARVRWLDDDERARLLEACDRSDWPKMKLLILMALGTGARKSELLNLRWLDIDFGRKVAQLADTKNGKPRTMPLPKPVIEELMRWREVGTGFVFPSDIKPGKPLEFRKHWDKLLIDAGIEDFRFHDLRHSAASYLVMAGATLHETAEILGHKSIETTKRYAHLSTQHKAAIAERVLGGGDKFIQGIRPSARC